MIISDELMCSRCGKPLHECVDHLIFRGKSYCSMECIIDEIDNEVEQGDEVVSTARFKEMEMCRKAAY